MRGIRAIESRCTDRIESRDDQYLGEGTLRLSIMYFLVASISMCLQDEWNKHKKNMLECGELVTEALEAATFLESSQVTSENPCSKSQDGFCK